MTVQTYLNYYKIITIKQKVQNNHCTAYEKEVNKVVLLDELKTRLIAYEEPLKDLRDSL